MVSNNSSSEKNELTVRDCLFWLLWQVTARSMIELTEDERVLEFVGKTEEGINKLIAASNHQTVQKALIDYYERLLEDKITANSLTPGTEVVPAAIIEIDLAVAKKESS